jgi:hypothetical protein
MAEPKQDTLSMEQLTAKYAIAAAILNSDKTLQDALNRILNGKITDPALQMAELQKSEWFIKNSEDWRKFQVAKTKNPATFEADLIKNTNDLLLKYKAAGIPISTQEATSMAEKLMMKSQRVDGKMVVYDNTYINNALANAIDFSKTRTVGNVTLYDLAGNTEKLANQLYDMAWDYGFQSTKSNKGFDQWLQNSVRGLVAGTITEEDLKADLTNSAASAFPGLAAQLSRGQTLREAADPWLKALADTWEIDQDTLDLNDDYVNRILNQTDEKGNVAPMNLYQAKTAARKSPKWQFTERAKEEYTGMGQKILQDFGFLG